MRWDPPSTPLTTPNAAGRSSTCSARSAPTAPAQVVDLGCGSGELTAMLAAALAGRAGARPGLLAGDDRRRRRLPATALQLRARLTPPTSTPAGWTCWSATRCCSGCPGTGGCWWRWAGQLNPGGWLAFQVPANFDSPSHVLMRELAESRRWAAGWPACCGTPTRSATGRTTWRCWLRPGCRSTSGRPRYLHVLAGADPVLEWVRGTGLRPVLAALDARPMPPSSRRSTRDAAAAGLPGAASSARSSRSGAPSSSPRSSPAAGSTGRMITGLDHVQVAIPAGIEDGRPARSTATCCSMTELVKPAGSGRPRWLLVRRRLRPCCIWASSEPFSPGPQSTSGISGQRSGRAVRPAERRRLPGVRADGEIAGSAPVPLLRPVRQPDRVPAAVTQPNWVAPDAL